MLCSEDMRRRYMKQAQDVKNLYTLCNGVLNQKIKDYLYVIFKFIGLSDMEISSIYLSKEKKKKHKMNLFK